MKKTILLSTTLMATLLMAEQPTPELLANIAKAKEVASAADAKLKALQAKLPQNQEIMTKLKLGYIKTDGNSNTETFSLDGNIKKEWGNNSLKLTLNGQYGNAENSDKVSEVTTNNYFTELEYAYAFTSKLSSTILVGYKNDKFSSYNYQSYIGPGVKYKAYKTDKQELNVEANILYSHDEIQDQFKNDSSLESDYGSYKAKLTYELQVMENLKFNQELSYRAAFDDSQNYFSFSKSELSSKISDIFSAGISYKIDYSNIVAEGIDKRDNTLTAFISLDY
jgi:putative salt-induced outer membrane protein